MVTFAERLSALRKSRGLSQAQLGEAVGLEQSEISRLERAQRPPRLVIMQLFADYFGVSLDYIGGREDEEKPQPKTQPTMVERARAMGFDAYERGPLIKLPVYEEAAAGNPRLASEDPIDYLTVEASDVQHDLQNFFFVEISGESMAPLIPRGAKVLVHRQTTVDSGQIALLRIHGDGVAVKRVRLFDSRVLLQSENPAYPDQEFSIHDVDIIGRAVKSVAIL